MFSKDLKLKPSLLFKKKFKYYKIQFETQFFPETIIINAS